ncbi:hypothetical protein BJ742DRAFT_814813 [Cladochytrium replicatum]|nr:hypothetical protein BJ742DRAFT_814813 [Cladochytrium replicatum]
MLRVQDCCCFSPSSPRSRTITTSYVIGTAHCTKGVGTTEDELRIALEDALVQNAGVGPEPTKHSDETIVQLSKLWTAELDESRDDLDITVQLTLPTDSVKSITESCRYFNSFSTFDHVDTAIVSWAGFQDFGTNTQTLVERFLPLWRELEACVQEAKVISRLGITGATAAQLEVLLPHCVIAPGVIQLVGDTTSDLEDFENLSARSKAGFEIWLHGNAQGPLSPKNLQSVHDRFQTRISARVDPSIPIPEYHLSAKWILKYTIFVKPRMVLCEKGYIACVSAQTQY